MKNFKVNTNLLKWLILLLTITTGCASWFMNGGVMVDKDYVPEIIIKYKAEGVVPSGVDYLLVRTENGESIFERSLDGSGVLFQAHWEDEEGDHYAGWVSKSHGYEFIVPKDKKNQPTKKFVYPAGYYNVTEIDGVMRPVPLYEIEPVAVLIP